MTQPPPERPEAEKQQNPGTPGDRNVPIIALLKHAAGLRASNLRLEPGNRPLLTTTDGEVAATDKSQTAEEIKQLLAPVVTPQVRKALANGHAEWTVKHKEIGTIRITLEIRSDGPTVDIRFLERIPTLTEVPIPPVVVPETRTGVVSPASRAVAEMESLFLQMVEMKASDLHMSVGSPPIIRVDGKLLTLPGRDPLTAEDTERLMMAIAPPKNQRQFSEINDTDFAYELPEISRFRCNLFRDRKGIGGVFRTIPTKIVTVEEMGLTEEILQLCHLPKGLVLVTGPTGAGKSTTLSALIDFVNRQRTDHVITVEDPIEFVHENKKCLINQREVGEHTGSFKHALRAALREDPDVVLVGEMRDLETIAIAIETAETGHLVFATLHTTTAMSSIDRIIDQFPADQQEQVRVMLADNLKGVLSQVLCRKITGGRVPAFEIMFGIPAVANLIRESKTFQIPSIIQASKGTGMCLMNDSLLDLVVRKVIAPEEGYAKAIDKMAMLAAFKAKGISTSWGRRGVAPDKRMQQVEDPPVL